VGEKCIFEAGWKCPVEGGEVPLEVCKTCVRAKSVALRLFKGGDRGE